MPKIAKNGKKETASLEDLLIFQLRTLMDAETELVKALPKMAERAADVELKEGFEKHLRQTEHHVQRLDQALIMLDSPAQKVKGESIRGLIDDADWVLHNVKRSELLDASLIAVGRCAEHYEIASYSTAVEWAKLLGQQDLADLLQETLQEEIDTDQKLSELAKSKVNERAMIGDNEA